MDKNKTCFFTGHRKLKNDRLDTIKEKIYENAEKLIIEKDVDTFISGAALGFDTIAAETIYELKKKYQHIKLILYLPCYGQSKLWGDDEKFRYRMLLAKADDYTYITEEEYNNECMLVRNLSMIRDSAYCIAYCILSNSGTGFTLKNAEAVGVDIVNIADELYK